MVTRKTRWMSGLVAILMLVSLLAGFVIPVSAAGQVDLKAATGLVDKTALPNIADGLKTDVKEYQVSNRAGLEKLVEICKNDELYGYTLWQTADIDMGWEPFAGIAGHNGTAEKSFRAVYDGNGFVIKNLYIMKPTGKEVGFFNRTHSTTIRNVGIASGLIVGHNFVGGMVGYGNSGDTVINCWNAATVVYLGNADAGGGLYGRSAGAGVKFHNCYNLGMVIDRGITSGGLSGWINGTIDTQNSYNAGDIVSGFNVAKSNLFASVYGGNQLGGYTALIRTNADAAKASTANNNYYLAYEGGLKSIKDAHTAGVKITVGGSAVAVNNIDDATAVTRTELATLASKLNEGDMSIGTTNGYTVKYVDTVGGYPAIGYYNAENELVVCRTAAEGAKNVACNDWAVESDLFKAFSDKRLGGFTAEGSTDPVNRLTDVTIDDANDLFAFAIFSSSNNVMSNMIEDPEIEITADIDAAAQTMVPGLAYGIPIAMNSALTGATLDGNNHVIYNWKSYAVVAGSTPRGGFIGQISNTTVKNLGLVDANCIYDFYYASGYSYPTLMIEMVYGTGSVVENCFATGEINILHNSAKNVNNNSAIVSRTMDGTNADGIPSVTLNNVWGYAKMTYPDSSVTYGRALGSTKAEYGTGRSAVLNNVSFIAPGDDYYYGSPDNTTDDPTLQAQVDLRIADGSMAAYLNDTTAGVYYTVKNGKTVFGTAENATHSVTAKKKMENGTITGTEVTYYNAGATAEIPVIAGYELDKATLPAGAGETSFTMPTTNVELDYYVKGIDFTAVEEIAGELAQYDPDLFTDASALEQVKEAADAALAYKDKEQTPENVAAANAAITAAINAYNALDLSALTLKETYPNVPLFSDYEIYKDYNPMQWGIASKEDWIAATEYNATNFKNMTLHLLNNVDMGDENVKPLAYGKAFDGILDGHGFAFENYNMTITVGAYPVGLVGTVGGVAIVKNLGIASGKVVSTYVSGSADVGTGGIAGNSNGGSQILNCWNAASVTTSGMAGASVAGIAGRGLNNSIIDGCYNLGTITGVNHAAGINDWGQTDCYVRNSYNAGKLIASNTAVIRCNNNAKSERISNVYAIGTNFANEPAAYRDLFNKAPYMQDAETVSTGELAWILNSNNSTGLKTYWTVKDGKTVFGTADDLAVRVAMVCPGAPTEYIYAVSGDTVTLNYADNAEYALADGAVGTLNGKELIVGNEDVTVNVTIVGLNYKNLDDAFAYYAERDTALYADQDDVNLTELIATLKTMQENDAFGSQGELDAYASLLMGFELINEYPALPAAKDAELYPTAQGFRINDLADLEYVATNRITYTVDQTLYITADIEVPTGSVANDMNGLKASIDGLGNALKGITFSGKSGWLQTYSGRSIKNLVMDSWNATNLPWQGALLMYQPGANVTLENITMVNCTAKSSSDTNGMGGLIGIVNNTNRTVTFKNIVIEDCTLDRSSRAGNSAFLVGRLQNGTATVDGVKITGTTIADPVYGSGQGLLFGEITGDVTIKNVYVADTDHGEAKAVHGIIVGFFKVGGEAGDDATPTLILENIVVDDALDTALVCRGNTKEVTFEATHVYATGKLMSNSVEMAPTATAAQMADGSLAYAANAMGYDFKWEMLPGATAPSLDEDGAGLPYEVTFYATNSLSEEYETVLYTDSEGKLIGLTADLLNKAEWEGEAELAEKTFTANAAIIGILPVIHDHVWGNATHIDGTNTHMEECTFEGCNETRTVECDFDEIKTVDANAAPDAAAHAAYCDCGISTAPVLCSEADPNFLRMGYDPTCEEPGEENYECELCGYIGSKTIDPIGHKYTGSWTADPVADGATKTHSRLCDNDCGEKETENCTFSGEWTELGNEMVKYCDDRCGAYIVQLTTVGSVTIESETGIAGRDMVVDLILNENPGVSGADITITYDSDALELKGVAAGDWELGLLDKGPVTEPDANGMVSVIANFANYGTITEDGVLLKVTFTVKEEAEAGDYDFAVKVHASDFDGNEFDFGPYAGFVTVTDIIPGDINGNGFVTIADAVLMLRVAAGETDLPEGLNLDAADVITDTNTEDLKINTDDVVLVLKYLNGEIAEL